MTGKIEGTQARNSGPPRHAYKLINGRTVVPETKQHQVRVAELDPVWSGDAVGKDVLIQQLVQLGHRDVQQGGRLGFRVKLFGRVHGLHWSSYLDWGRSFVAAF